jgi:hypothetical protein
MAPPRVLVSRSGAEVLALLGAAERRPGRRVIGISGAPGAHLAVVLSAWVVLTEGNYLRHVTFGKTPEEAEAWAERVDEPNARTGSSTSPVVPATRR